MSCPPNNGLLGYEFPGEGWRRSFVSGKLHQAGMQYQTMDGKPRIKTFTGWTAQIIQHEIDHCDGILI